MNSMLKYGLIGVGGYLLYRQFWGESSSTETSTAAATPGGVTGSRPAPAGGASGRVDPPYLGRGGARLTPVATGGRRAESSASNTVEALGAAARSSMGATWDGRLNAHQWNFFYSQVRGVAGPDPGGLFADPMQAITIAEYWPIVAGAGFTGLNYRRAGYGV